MQIFVFQHREEKQRLHYNNKNFEYFVTSLYSGTQRQQTLKLKLQIFLLSCSEPVAETQVKHLTV